MLYQSLFSRGKFDVSAATPSHLWSGTSNNHRYTVANRYVSEIGPCLYVSMHVSLVNMYLGDTQCGYIERKDVVLMFCYRQVKLTKCCVPQGSSAPQNHVLAIHADDGQFSNTGYEVLSYELDVSVYIQ